MCEDRMTRYAVPFTMWELRLYLDTHPQDERALTAYRQMAQAHETNYAAVPDDGNGTRWSWVDGPWPWEYGFGCVRGGV